MLTIEKPKDIFQHIGTELGPSEWLTVTQEMIDKFAEATATISGSTWTSSARTRTPGGKTIAHGYLTLSLLPRLAPTLDEDHGAEPRRELWLQQGPLHQPGSRRLAHPAASAPRQCGGDEGQGREDHQRDDHRGRGERTPAMVAETMGVVYP